MNLHSRGFCESYITVVAAQVAHKADKATGKVKLNVKQWCNLSAKLSTGASGCFPEKHVGSTWQM